MLIIPVEKSVNWRRPPWFTLAIIALNVLFFVINFMGDADLYDKARQKFVEAELPAIEIPAYETYLDRKIALEGDDRSELLLAIKKAKEQNDVDWVIDTVLIDLGFVEYLKKDAVYFWQEDVYAHWLESRGEIGINYLSKLSFFAYGLLPDEINLSDLISYQFMHGGWGHLIGNMVFLFLVGYTVERALGGVRFLIAYLLCGLGSGLFYTLITDQGLVPLVGASGSISGLMGMYVAIFGLAKIRFFYSLGFYFGYFTAPALAVLPVWLIKELVEYGFDHGSGIAFMAHVGGLLVGAALVLLFGKSWLQVKEEFHEASEDEKDEEYRRLYDQALKALARMEFSIALERFRVLVRKYPKDNRLLLHLYHLEKLNPAAKSYQSVLVDTIEHAIKVHDYSNLMGVYREAHEAGENGADIEDQVVTKVLYACIREGEMKDAEAVFGHLKSRDCQDLVREACMLMIDAFKQRQLNMKVSKYQGVLSELN